MERFIVGVALILLSHQIVTISTYITLLDEDGKIKLPHPPKPIVAILRYLLYAPMFGNFIYDISFGLVDYFRSNRLCNMIADRDEEIERLKEENVKIKNDLRVHKKYEDHLLDVSKIDPRIYSYSNYEYIEKLGSDDE